MKLVLASPAKALNKAYLKQSLKRDQVELFKANLARMFERIRVDEHEEHLKNIVADFLKDTWYKQTNEINTSGRADLAIHNGATSTASVGVLIEVKRPGNKSEMISPDKPNAKALHELLHYYMQERYLKDNKEIRHLIVCNIYEWHLFDAADFERFFFGNHKLVQSYKDWNDGLLVSVNTDWFYQEIAKPFIEKELADKYRELVFFYKHAPSNKALVRKQIENLKHDLENFGLPNDKDLIALRKKENEVAQLGFAFDKKGAEAMQRLMAEVVALRERFAEKERLVYSNAFEWRFEFPEVLDQDGEFIGFDAVIGNPPYGLTFTDEVLPTLKAYYKSFEYQANSYVLFLERADSLLRAGGILDFIVPATFTYQNYFKNIRSLFKQRTVTRIRKFNFKVFEDADIGDCVSFQAVKNDAKSDDIIEVVFSSSACQEDSVIRHYGNNKLYLSSGAYNLSDIEIDFSKFEENSENLGSISEIVVGIKPYQVGKGKPKQTRYIVENKVFTSNNQIDENFLPCFNGKDFYRYAFINTPKMFLKYGEWLAEPREIAPFFEDKIILRQTSDSIIAHIDETKSINLNNVYNVGKLNQKYRLKYVLALLNSKLINVYYQSISQERGRVFAEVKKVYLEQIPIKFLDIQNQTLLITLVDQILAAKKADPKTDTSILEAEIDRLVYALYGLTEDEISLVEGKR